MSEDSKTGQLVVAAVCDVFLVALGGGRGQARTKREEREEEKRKKKKKKKKKKRKDVGIDVPIRRVWMGKTVCSVRNVIANVMVVLVPKHKRKEIRQQHLLAL